jgi:hypothetical protein
MFVALVIAVALAQPALPARPGPQPFPPPDRTGGFPGPLQQQQRTMPNTVPGGSTDNEPALEAVEVDYTELEVAERAEPRWPRGVKDTDVTTCTMRTWIDANGNPMRADPAMCDPRFVNEATRTVLKWRFEPWEEDGDRVAVVTLVPVEFERRSTR